MSKIKSRAAGGEMSFKVTLLVYCMTARMMTATVRFITLVGKFNSTVM